MRVPWLSLIVVVLICAIGSVLTYYPGVKTAAWYPWVMSGMSVIAGLVYGFAAKGCRSDDETFALSMAWDVVAALIYVIIPVCLFGVRLTVLGWAGLVMAAIGVVILKCNVRSP